MDTRGREVYDNWVVPWAYAHNRLVLELSGDACL